MLTQGRLNLFNDEGQYSTVPNIKYIVIVCFDIDNADNIRQTLKPTNNKRKKPLEEN